MVLTSVGKKFVYVSILMMVLSMVLPWESLSDYTYSESMGLLINITTVVIFAIAALIVVLRPIATILNKIGTNYVFLVLCLLNAIVLYFGMQYYPDTYTIGYLLFPTAVITYMFGVIFSVNTISKS